MAMDRDSNLTGSGSTIPPRDSTMYDRDTMNTTDVNTPYDRDATHHRGGGSNFLAFLIGGVIIAIGLMAFLFYDGGSNTGRDVSTTSSTTPRIEAPANPGASSTPAAPARPTNPQ